MSGARTIWNDGMALATSDLTRLGNGAASADDRVYETLTTPPSLGAKTIDPTSIETPTVNPRLLCVPGAVSGTVQLQPCKMQVGSPSIALAVALQATLKTAIASALCGANSSGSTRYDLVYATAQRIVTMTAARAIKSTADGSISVNPTVNIEDTPTPTLTILPNVGNVTPLATMPADNNGGANGEPFGVYNFPIALIAVPNGYASGGAITQSMITQLWSGGWVAPHRVRGPRPMSIYYGAANEKAPSALASLAQGAERWGSQAAQFFAHFTILNTTPAVMSSGVVLDSSIDWRHRFIYGFFAYQNISGNALPIEPAASTFVNPPQGSASGANTPVKNGCVLPPTWTGAGSSTSQILSLQYVDATGAFYASAGIGVRPSDGALLLVRGSVLDTTHGDVMALVLNGTDQLLTGM